ERDAPAEAVTPSAHQLSLFRSGLRLFVFFFSSRRRHTRFKCDWSSDVCSSDLHCRAWQWRVCVRGERHHYQVECDDRREAEQFEIGRASCRERGERWGVGGGVKKKKGRRE